ncbi:MAG: hypothetical protein ACLRSD_11120 [Oscillibacter sp.]
MTSSISTDLHRVMHLNGVDSHEIDSLHEYDGRESGSRRRSTRFGDSRSFMSTTATAIWLQDRRGRL